MLTLFERNDFIKEVQALLGERLLTAEVAHSELEKEVCEHLYHSCVSLLT